MNFTGVVIRITKTKRGRLNKQFEKIPGNAGVACVDRSKYIGIIPQGQNRKIGMRVQSYCSETSVIQTI